MLPPKDEPSAPVSSDLIKDRLKFLDEANKKQAEPVKKDAQNPRSSDLVKERLKWVEEEKARLNAIPQNEHLNDPVSRDLIKDKLKFLEEEHKRLAEGPKQSAEPVVMVLTSYASDSSGSKRKRFD